MHVWWWFTNPASPVDIDGWYGCRQCRMMLRCYGWLVNALNKTLVTRFNLICITTSTWLLSITITLHYFYDDASHHLLWWLIRWPYPAPMPEPWPSVNRGDQWLWFEPLVAYMGLVFAPYGPSTAMVNLWCKKVNLKNSITKASDCTQKWENTIQASWKIVNAIK